jgi:NDP-sugar pyrophosphorylase family protein
MNNQNVQLVIPMSGSGKRFLDAGYTTPKPLIEVDGKPIIAHVIDMFPGVDDVIFICNQEHIENTEMEAILKRYCPTGKIVTIPKHKKGPVYAVAQIFNEIDEERPVIVSYCDYGTVWDFNGFLDAVEGFDGAIPCYTGFHPHMLGSDNYAFCKEDDGVLLEIKEKEPFTDNKMSEFASNGTYYFKNGALVKTYFQKLIDLDISLKEEYYVSLVYNLLVEDGYKIRIFEIDKMLQWGTPYDLEIYKGWSKYFSNIAHVKEEEEIQNTTLVLPMAGRGDRFTQEGFKTPKPLIEVDGLPMVVKAVECLPRSKNETFICLQEHVEHYGLSDTIHNHYPEANITTIDNVTEGQACTCEIGIVSSEIDPESPILISACDNGVHYDADEYLSLVKNEDNDVIVWSFRNNQTSKINPNMYSWLDVDQHNNVLSVSCKKFTKENPLEEHAIIGTMYFRKAKYFLEGLKRNYEENVRTNGEFYVDDVINQNIKSGLTVKVFEVENYICWGTPNDYKTYNYWQEFFDKSSHNPYHKSQG